MSFREKSWKFVSPLALAVLAAGCAASSAAEGGAAAAAPVAVTPEMIQAGRLVFSGAGNCQTCHGANGVNGRFGPNLADSDWLWLNPSSPTLARDIADLVRRGIPQPRGQTPMPAMGGRDLSEDQLMAVGAYVASLSQ
jgi:mono/diheme cytochrome c family protein